MARPRLDQLCILGLLTIALGPSPLTAGDGVVALQTADPSCGSNSAAIYVDCGNGTVTDTRTGLVWLQNANCFDGYVDWHTAMEVAAGLSDLPDGSLVADHDCGLSDGSSPGEWRLPSAGEWEAMVADAVEMGCDPTLTSDSAISPPCWSEGCVTVGACAFLEVQTAYWSSTSGATFPQGAFYMSLSSGSLVGLEKATGLSRIWPVRGGQ